MARKDHLITIQEDSKLNKKFASRNDVIAFQAQQPTIAQQINGIGATSKTPDEVKDTKFPVLNPIDPIGKNLTDALSIDLALENSPFHCLELSDVGATVATLTVNLVNLVKNKAEKFILDITKDSANTIDPTIAFSPTVENLPAGFPTADPRYLLEIVARDTPNETRFEVVNRIGTTGVSFPLTPDVKVHGNVTGAVTIDLSLITAHYHTMILIGNITFTFSNPPATNKELSFILDITQDAIGGRTVGWPPEVRVDPTVGSAANARTVIIVTTVDNGVNYDALIVTGGDVDAANKELSNLIAQTAINTNLDPGTAGVRNFGDAVLFWNKLFIEEIIFPDTQTLTDISDPTLGFDSGLTPPALYFNAPSGSEISNRIAGTRILAIDALAVTMYFGGLEEFKFLQDRFEMNDGDIFELGNINFNTDMTISDLALNSITTSDPGGLNITVPDTLDTLDVFIGGDKILLVTDVNIQALSGSPNTLSAAYRLFRDDPSPVAGNVVGTIHFDGKDLVPGFREYASIFGSIANTGVGTQEGNLDFRVAEVGVTQIYIDMNLGGNRQISFERVTRFPEITDPILPAALVDEGQLFAKDVGGNTELFWRRAPDENISQVTNSAGGGANQQLSNLSGTIAVNLDLLPNQATGGNLGSDTATEEWFNLFTDRVQFPQFISPVTSIPSIQWVDLAIDEFRFNTPTGDIFGWWVGSVQEMELSNTTLKLEGVDLNLDIHDIIGIGTTISWNEVDQSITSDATGLDITTPAGDFIKLTPGTTMTAEFNDFFFRLKNVSTFQTPQIILHMDDSSPSIGQIIGHFFFDGEDSIGTQTTYASINAEIKTPTNGSEDGIIRLNIMNNGLLGTVFEGAAPVGGGTPMIGFRGAVPQTVKSYSRVTTTTDRAVSDTSTITTQELGNIVGTLLKDLSDMKIITGV